MIPILSALIEKQTWILRFVLLPSIISLITFLDIKAQSQVHGLKQLQSMAMPLLAETSDQAANAKIYESLFKGKELIALGESTHGTKEFNVYRDQMIRAMVSNGSVKTIVFEADYCSLSKLNDLLVYGKSDSLLKGMPGLYGIYRTREVYEMLLWVYKYNQSVQVQERVQIKGGDMQDPYSITKSILDNLKNPKLLRTTSLERLQKLHLLYKPAKEMKHSKADMTAYREMIKDLYTVFAQHENSESRQYVRLLEQTLALREAPFSQYGTLRDQFMAENVMHIYNQKPEESKVILWAHNGHIAHARLSKIYRMGYHLKDELGEKYYALALAFNEGASRIFDVEGSSRGYKKFDYPASLKTNSLEFVLQGVGHPAFVIDLQEAKKEENAKALLDKAKYMRVIGATYLEPDSKNYFWVPVFESFDGILFFQKTTAAESITSRM